MTTRRKSLPHAANQLIDMAIMANSEVVRILKPIIEKDMTNLEVMRRIGLAIHNAHESIDFLKEIKETTNGE